MATSDAKQTETPPSLEEAFTKSKTSSTLAALHDAVLRSNKLPNTDQLEFLCAISSKVKELSNQVSTQLVKTIQKLSTRYTLKIQVPEPRCSASAAFPVEELFDNVVDAIDEGIDYFNNALDTARGIENANVALSGAIGPEDARKLGLLRNTQRLAHLDIEKPQLQFPDYPIDNSDAPFVTPYHTLTCGSSINVENKAIAEDDVNDYLRDLYKNNADGNGEVRHPYEDEISAAAQLTSQQKFDNRLITVFKSLDETPFTYVTTEEELFEVADRIRNAAEIAVDLENHSVRSFQGFTCLMQLSTRREDIVIDTLTLRGSIHRALAPIFADEGIVKVLHGADYDVQWLERDFGIYVVNMFDTGQASRLLQYPSAGLWYLLSQFCSVSTALKKRFQTADWRVRPLPEDMIAYARSDTHYLLYVYDRLRDNLNKKSILQQAWERSANVCRKRHSKPRFRPGMARELAARHGLGIDPRQIQLLEALCKWRDVTARESDESLGYVCPLPVLFGIVLARDKARSVNGLLEHGFPGGFIPPLIRIHMEEIAQLVKDALDAKICSDDNEDIRAEAASKVDKVKTDELVTHTAPTSLSCGNLKVNSVASNIPKPTSAVHEHESPNQQPRARLTENQAAKPFEASVSVVLKEKSELFGSDSESDSCVDEIKGGLAAASRGRSSTTASTDGDRIVPGEIAAVGNCDMQIHIDGGDDESDKSGEKIRLDLVVKVQDEIEAHMRKLADRSKISENVAQESTKNNKTFSGMDSDVVSNHIKTEDVFSLEEMYGQKPRRQESQGRKRIRSVNKEELEEIAPFDYKKAKLEDAKVEDVLIEQYNPMGKLLEESYKRSKSRVQKRRMGKSRAMTFK